MAYNNQTDRTEAGALIPEDVAATIWKSAEQESAVLTQFTKTTMSRKQQRIPVMSALPVAYFRGSDTGLAQTTELAWANKYLNAEPIDVIVPIPEDVIDDADFDMWAEIKPKCAEAIGRAFDAAVFFGVNAPATFPTAVVTAAVAAGNTVNRSATAANGGIFGDIDAMLSLLEADGYDANTFLAHLDVKGLFRSARNADGDRIDRDRISGQLSEYDGSPLLYPMRGLFPSGANRPRVIGLDKSQFIVGVRKDIEYKLLDQAVITDNTGAIIFNLPQQAMVALKLTARFAWQVANPINFDQTVEANRYPAAVVREP